MERVGKGLRGSFVTKATALHGRLIHLCSATFKKPEFATRGLGWCVGGVDTAPGLLLPTEDKVKITLPCEKAEVYIYPCQTVFPVLS